MTLNAEKRIHARYAYSSTLDYSVGQVQVSRKAITVNMSFSGLCLYLYEPLAVGEQITIQNSVLPLPHKEATVKWIQEGAMVGIYKAGVEFCSLAQVIE